MAQGGLPPSVIPAHERESRCGGGDGLPSARERRSIVCPSEERSEEESQAVLGCLHCTPRVGCPARCRGGSRTAPTRSHRQFRPRIGVRGRRRAGIQGRGVGAGGGLGFFTAFRMTGTRDHSCGLRPSVIPAHERESRRGGGDRLPSARERRSIVRHSEERSEEESQAVLVRRHCTSKVSCPARCRGGSRTAPTGSHRHFRPRIGVRGRRRAGIQGRGVGTGDGLGFFTAFRMTGTRDHSCGCRPSVIPATERASKGAEGFVRARRTPRPLPAS